MMRKPVMSQPTLEEMKALLLEHEWAERNGDLDGTMATLVAHPVFEVHPQGLRIEGYEAVREMYGRLLPGSNDPLSEGTAQTERVLQSSITASGNSVLCTEVQHEMHRLDGTTACVRMLVNVYFQDGKLLGERLFSDNDMAELINSALGPDFFNLPGVTTIVDDYPHNPGA
jgi:hypothetical protein